MADLTIVEDDVQNSDAGTVISGDAAVDIAAGQAVYKLANGKYGLADADGTTPSFKVVGIALDSAGPDQPVSICTSDPDFVPGATLVKGVTYILSGNAGGIAPDEDADTGWNKQIIGVATSTTNMLLRITQSNAVFTAPG
jgi:hypothetical protein